LLSRKPGVARMCSMLEIPGGVISFIVLRVQRLERELGGVKGGWRDQYKRSGGHRLTVPTAQWRHTTLIKQPVESPTCLGPTRSRAVCIASRVLLVGLTRESSAAIWLALPGFVEPAGSTAVD